MNTDVYPAVQAVDALPDVKSLPPGSRHRYALKVVTMADGTTLHLPVNVLVGQADGPVLLMVAGVHGDEYEGITAQLELWRELNPEDVSGVVVMVPVANPPAFRASQRRNPADMLDMNRVFPGKAQGAVTEQLAYHLYHEVARRCDVVLSMHGWTFGALVVPYVEYPLNAATTEAARAAAAVFGLEYVEGFDWHPGLLVAACTKAGIVAIEPEIGGLSCTLPERRARYKQGARNLMIHLDMLSGEISAPASVSEVRREMLFAPIGGVLRRHKELEDPVAPGDAVATIADLNGTPLVTLTATAEGFVAAQRLAATVNPGDLVAVIFTVQEG
jgi:N-alpha-acetyl-L-2,4-diaminobutyrate deacetylase